LDDERIDGFSLLSDGRPVASGRWTVYASRRQQEISVNSALVKKGTARALVRALQSHGGGYVHRLPYYEDENGELLKGNYVLKGWVSEVGSEEKGLDEFDAWAAGVGHRTLAPSQAIISQMGLVADAIGRNWSVDGIVAFSSEIWSERPCDEDGRQSHGRRLIASPALVDSLIKKTGMSLIIEVEVKRQLAYSRYDGLREKNGQDANSITQIILFEKGKEPVSVRSNSKPRPKTRNRSHKRR